MFISLSYKATIRASFVGYIAQAIVNMYIPLLFVTFQAEYQVSLSQITLLVTLNFGTQLLTDMVSVSFIDRIGYRASMVAAHLFCAAGLISLSLLPEFMPAPFLGIVISVIIYAVGGGLLEVLVSPVVEACPTKNKEQAMSMLHSFYCWGVAAVVTVSTLFFALFGIEHWRLLACIWSLLPFCNALIFLKVPIAPLIPSNEKGLSLKGLLSTKIFWVMVLLMFCAGSCEHSVGQWTSAFAEAGLGVNKAVGNLTGLVPFYILMAISRTIYGKFGERMDLKKCMLYSGILCLLSYLLVSLAPTPVLSLMGCGLCGFSVGLLWPGTFSLAAISIHRGGTAMYALLALAGDLGCGGGPTFVGLIADATGDRLDLGILSAIAFPLLLIVIIALFCRTKPTQPEHINNK